MNKQEIKDKIAKLNQEIDDLEEQLSKPTDLFTITTYKQVCEELSIKEQTRSNFRSDKAFAVAQLLDIEELFNQGSKNNLYYPYFERKKAGLVFIGSYDDCFFGGQVSLFKDRQTSDYVSKTFIKLYEQLV